MVVHVPPFVQGFDSHMFISSKKKIRKFMEICEIRAIKNKIEAKI